ncbi:MAG TPA: response regulator [Clostridiales bacterium]|nr:response regulator [Clostridiales bacterium]
MFTVVVVDDEYWALQGIINTFKWQRYGLKVIFNTCDPLEAWEKIQELKPDVVFTDIMMPNMTGLELAENIRNANIDCELVILTGYSEFEYAKQAISLRVFEYFLKPIDPNATDKLLSNLYEHLKRKNGINSENEFSFIENKQFQEMVQYINQNYGEMLHITKLCKKFYIDVSYCNKLFHQYFKKTFTEYVTDIRMNKAKEFISKGFSIKDVGGRVGYTDYNYFLKAFKKYYGVSPSEYKKGI